MRIASFFAAFLLFMFGNALSSNAATRPFSVSWSVVDAQVRGDYWDVLFSSPANGVLVGRNGAIARTTDGGATWHQLESGVADDLWSVSFPTPTSGWIAGDHGAIVATSDGGATWRKQSSGVSSRLVSVHFVNVNAGWAIAADGKVIATADGGVTWKLVWSDSHATFAATTFVDRRTGWIVGGEGKIFRTRDGGTTWQRQESGTSQNLWSVQFSDLNNGWAVGDSGTLLVTHDGGVDWQPSRSGSERDLSRIYFANPSTGWIVADGGTILTTRDGGEHWRSQDSGTKRYLIGVHFADERSGWIVGFRGVLLKASLDGVSAEIDSVLTHPSGLLGEVATVVDLREGSERVKSVYVWARLGEAAWISIGEANQNASSKWELFWRPSRFGFRAGDEIEFRIQPDDGGPPTSFTTGRFVFEPWWISFWRENEKALKGVLIAIGAAALVLAGTLALLALAPASLAQIGSLPLGNEQAELKWSVISILSVGNRLFQDALLSPLCRHSRVKRAWTKRYLEGRAKFEDLSASARRVFFEDDGILDAWIARVADQVEDGLGKIEFLQQRRVYVEFPLNDAEGARFIERPSPEAFQPAFKRSQTVISIVGVGGAGKSTLACALGRWVFDPDARSRPAGHRMVPIFLAEETTDLLETVAAHLHRMVVDEEHPLDLIKGLLSKKRILVIVDALSERSVETQTYVEHFHKLPYHVGALVVTSRMAPDFGPVERTTVYPVRLDARRIVPFIIGYLDRIETEEPLRSGRVQLLLGEKILALAESGGQRAPITALLVTMFVDSARRHIRNGQTLDELPKAMPEIFIDYLKRLNTTTGTFVQKVDDPTFILAAQIAATVSLGNTYVPGDFAPSDVITALSSAGLTSNASLLLDQLIGSGLIERRAPGGYFLLRFDLDPVAEYLGAIRKVVELRTDSKRWRAYIGSLRKVEGYPNAVEGYLSALSNCHSALKAELRLSDVVFPWDEDIRIGDVVADRFIAEQRPASIN